MFASTRDNGVAEVNTVNPRDPAEALSVKTRNRLLGLVFAFCALSFALVGLLPNVFYGVVPTHDYLVFHIAFEFMSIVVSFAVFTVGWYGYKQNANKQDLVIGITFLMVGIVDFAHTLSYNGMPAFLSPNSVSKAAMYWMAGRLIDGVGILFAAFVLADSRRKLLSPGYLAVGAMTLVGALTLVVSRYPHVLPPMYVPGEGLTPLKIALEWLVISLYALSIYLFGRRSHRETNVILLQMALVVGIFSELSFTLYRSAYDTYNLLGHVYKVAAYYMIFRALFVSSFQKPYYELLKARTQVEKSFARIGDALASSLELTQTLQLVSELASNMLGVKSATVMLMEDGELQIKAQIGARAPLGSDISTTHTAAGQAILSRRPVVVDDVTALPGHDPSCHCQNLIGPPARSVVSAPILSGKDVLGVIEVYSSKTDAFGRKQADLLASFAGQAAVAIRNSITYEREHQIAELLQRSVLPEPPAIPGMDIAMRYIPAEDATRVGGDLYDVFQLDDGKLVLVIGDVSGHQLDAVSMMAMTVHTIRGLILHGMTPGEAFELTNVALARRNAGELRFVTVFAAIVDIKEKTLQYANAGHLMPIMLQEGVCASMEQQSELPLAIDESAKYHTWDADLSGVAGFLLYTDGLVEARKQGQMFGEERLTALCGEFISLSANDMIDRIIGSLKEWAEDENQPKKRVQRQDDVACLAVKWQ